MSLNKFSVMLLLSICFQQSYACDDNALGSPDPRRVAYNARRDAARVQTLDRKPNDITANNNGDETEVPDFTAQFTKLLEHDPVTGLLTAQGRCNYERLIKACISGKQADFNAIERTPGSQLTYVDPQAAFALTMEGEDSSLCKIALPPKLTSKEAAADLIEVYLNAVCRDVKFSEYGTGNGTDLDPVYGGSLTTHAAAILDDFGKYYKGPVNVYGRVDASVLFRGLTPGDKVGPFVSQFKLMPLYPLFVSGCVGATAALTGVPNLPIEAGFAVPQLYPIAAKREFGVTWEDYVAIQNGLLPRIYDSTDCSAHKRYPINGRDLGNYVHRDGPYESYYYALTTLAGRGFPLSPTIPYTQAGVMPNEGAGITLGGPDAFGLIATAGLIAFRAGWTQKWRCHRRIRPEAMAGLVHQVKVTGKNPFDLHSSLFKAHNGFDYLALVRKHNEYQSKLHNNALPLSLVSTYLLAQLFPEGCPQHPSYPSGHATGAGACVTILKAMFDEDTKINTKFAPVKVDPNDPTKLVPLTDAEGANELTVGGELNKLAFTISMARNFAGVHYRSDAWNGMLLGEAIAISILQDHTRVYHESGFHGFTLTKFNGVKILITPEEIIEL